MEKRNQLTARNGQNNSDFYNSKKSSQGERIIKTIITYEQLDLKIIFFFF